MGFVDKVMDVIAIAITITFFGWVAAVSAHMQDEFTINIVRVLLVEILVEIAVFFLICVYEKLRN